MARTGPLRNLVATTAVCGLVLLLLVPGGAYPSPHAGTSAPAPARGYSSIPLPLKTPNPVLGEPPVPLGAGPLPTSRHSAGTSNAPTAAPPRLASKVDPLLGYSREPAPMGIADFGVTGAQSDANAYEYATNSFEGRAFVNSMDVSIPGTASKVTAFELNVVLVLQLGGKNYSYWIQNGLHVDASSRQFTIGGAYVWNFSAPSARLSPGELRGNSTSVLVTDTYYFIPGCGGFSGECSTLSWPATVAGRVVTSANGGIPFVDYQYNLGSGWVTYDNVSFLHMSNATDVGFVVDGHQATPIGPTLFYDAEWDWVAAGGGGSGIVKGSDLQMSLDFWNGRNFQAIPDAWNFGGNTGETSSNVSEALARLNSAGTPAAHVTNGAGSLGILYNQSTVGFLNLTIPTRSPQILFLNGTAVSIQNGTVNLTLAAGTYPAYLQNYSNSSQPISIAPGATTFVNLTGAGRVAFVESDLPAGISWGIALGSELQSSTASSIVFNVPNGTYAVNYSSVPGFRRNVSDPLQLTMPTSSPIKIGWSPFTYLVTFTEAGLPSSTSWWVRIAGSLYQGKGTTLEVAAPNGSTPYVVGSAYEFVASPSGGWVNVTRGTFAPIDVKFGYRPTFITGTVSPSDAVITINGTAQAVVGGGVFNDSVIPGTYTLVANATHYATQTIRVDATAGNVSFEPIVLVALPAPVVVTTPSGNSTEIPLAVYIGVIGAAVVAIAAVGALLLHRRSRSR